MGWEQPGIGPVRQLGVPVKMSRTPGTVHAPAPALGEHTDEVLRGWPDLRRQDRVYGGRAPPQGRAPRRRPGGSCVVNAPPQELLRISELAERAEVPVATVRHYLREGLLPEPVKTSRNMAYYRRVRRLDPADQAAPGGAVHAPAGDPRPARARGCRAPPACGR